MLAADPRWYETLGTSSWPEEAWRDPWVFRDPASETWHMLVTARANHGSDFGRGVIGHAISNDLATWQALPPISAPQSGFAHLEVPQMLELEGRWLLLFCCYAARLANQRRGSMGGIWIAPSQGPAGPVDVAAARLLLPERYYAGRAVQERDGNWALMAFVNEDTGRGFSGTITRSDAAATRRRRRACCARSRRNAMTRLSRARRPALLRGTCVSPFYRRAVPGGGLTPARRIDRIDLDDSAKWI